MAKKSDSPFRVGFCARRPCSRLMKGKWRAFVEPVSDACRRNPLRRENTSWPCRCLCPVSPLQPRKTPAANHPGLTKRVWQRGNAKNSIKKAARKPRAACNVRKQTGNGGRFASVSVLFHFYKNHILNDCTADCNSSAVCARFFDNPLISSMDAICS
ncbi:hypothetical protein Cdeb_01066 [Caldibacillus debilis GB1]|uniref:Uncharacterized protein n=1 Tax=Caldibacillus debilis GB1 TaxID=1339248 RepID=A0A420VFN4_9BACI|nr:hypothetical protein Cdeb_01066 [Caldibacillus debilis GB1]